MTDAPIGRALAYLERARLADGSFPSVVARNADLTREARPDPTAFVTSYAVRALMAAGPLVGRDLAPLLEPAVAFLERERLGPGLWRYWTRAHPQHRSIPVDLDDTAVAAEVLAHHGRPLDPAPWIDQRDPDGRFYTWALPRRRVPLRRWPALVAALPAPHRLLGFWKLTEAAPDDVDGVVNANVVACLGDRPETRAAQAFVEAALQDADRGIADKWHLEPTTFYYAAARAYAAGGCRSSGTAALLRERTLAVASVLEAPALLALALSAARIGGVPPSAVAPAADRLRAAQRPDGSWPGYALYWGGPERYWGWGSAALTTALAVEALARTSHEA